MLTRKQHDLLLYISEYLQENGVSPSFDEMKDALDLKSKSGIHRLITALEERGFIKRLAHRARALEVVKMPDAALPNDMRRTPAPARQAKTGLSEVPVYGRIAAGTPIEALQDPNSNVDVPSLLLAGQGEHYALEIDGDSMVDAGINDGDLAIIKKCDTAENGAIVVALVDNQEATLKRLHRKGKSVALEPANAAHETRIYGPGRVRVQGKLVGLLRKY